MAINRLNHAVLYVRDTDRTVAFFTEVLGFRRLAAYTFPGVRSSRPRGRPTTTTWACSPSGTPPPTRPRAGRR